MKVKVNNIFEKLHIKKQNVNEMKRRNKRNIKKTLEHTDSNITQEENIQFRRRGAIKNKTKINFNMLNLFRNRFAINRSYYVLFVFMSILAAVSVYTNFTTNERLNDESFAVFSNNDTENIVEQVESSVSEELQDANTNNNDTRKTVGVQTVATTKTLNTSTNSTPKKQAIIPLSFIKPIEGEIIKVYSMDKLIYSLTLESWKTHDGVDIKADIGKSVKSVEKGIVEKVYDDSFFGTTVIIDHGQGYKSIYSNLDANVSVKEKENIIKSRVIGKVGKTSIGEIKDESHIHFMLMFNNKIIDPTSKIKF